MKKYSVSWWKSKCDIVFARYLKLVRPHRCYTCSKWMDVKKLQAGHFVPRHHNNTRYDETNVQLQCGQCNMFEQGRQHDFGVHLDGELGYGTADRLKQKGYQPKKFTVRELEDLYDYYVAKVLEV